MSQPPKIWNCAFDGLRLAGVSFDRRKGNGPRQARRPTRVGAEEDITMTNAKRFYAVQIGNDYSSDWGSTRKREAIVMAHQAARENPGKEIRISICTTDDDFCDREIIIREGSRT